MEYYADQGWTDGLPVVPVTESYLAEFLAQTSRDPGDVLLAMPQLNRACMVRRGHGGSMTPEGRTRAALDPKSADRGACLRPASL